MADDTEGGRGKRKKIRSGWLAKDDADAQATEEAHKKSKNKTTTTATVVTNRKRQHHTSPITNTTNMPLPTTTTLASSASVATNHSGMLSTEFLSNGPSDSLSTGAAPTASKMLMTPTADHLRDAMMSGVSASVATSLGTSFDASTATSTILGMSATLSPVLPTALLSHPADVGTFSGKSHTLLSTHTAIPTLPSMSDCAIDSSGSALVYNIITSASVPPLDSSRDMSLGTALDIPIALSLDVPSGIIACPPNSSPKVLVSQEWVEGAAIAGGGVVPHGVEQRTYFNFINLPTTDSCCSQVDVDNGLWYDCGTCKKRVIARKGRPYTMARWLDHINQSVEHDRNLHLADAMKKAKAHVKAANADSTMKKDSLQYRLVKQNSLTETKKSSFFNKRQFTNAANTEVAGGSTPHSDKIVLCGKR
jgi:hypothetical protein